MTNKITYAPTASETVIFAAQELESYLSRMLPEGMMPKISLDVSADAAAESEDTAVWDASPAEKAEKCPDRYRIQLTGISGSITGCNDRSVLLGVYDYLHHLGCRFLGPGKECEIVPSISPDLIPASYERQASFYHRGVCIEGANSLENILDFIDWLPKVGYNSFFLQFKIPYTFLARWYHHERNPFAVPESYSVADAAEDMEKLEAAIKKRGLLLHKVGHGWTGETLGYETVAWKPDQTPLAPEKQHLAAEICGERKLFGGIPANTNLCYHDADAMDTFASLVTKYAKEHPTVDYLHIWLADTFNNVCECQDCRRTTPSDQYVNLLNEIDRRLTAENLDTRLVFLLYQELLWPPLQEKLTHPERFVLMFAPISRTFESSYNLDGPAETIPPYVRNHITMPTSLQMNLAYLQGWQQIYQGDSFVYDYPLGRAHYGDFGYVHISRIINGDIKKLHQMGLNGYISCQELRASLPNALPNYMMAYTLFDEGADAEEIIDEYFKAAYGADAVKAKAFLTELSRLSSCDYLNGKTARVSPDMARRLKEIGDRCQLFETALENHRDNAGRWDGLYWKLLGYHCSYILKLSEAMSLLASGENRQAGEEWLSMRDFICKNEQEYQPFLDVYRILEVTSNYTGFSSVINQRAAGHGGEDLTFG